MTNIVLTSKSTFLFLEKLSVLPIFIGEALGCCFASLRSASAAKAGFEVKQLFCRGTRAVLEMNFLEHVLENLATRFFVTSMKLA